MKEHFLTFNVSALLAGGTRSRDDKELFPWLKRMPGPADRDQRIKWSRLYTEACQSIASEGEIVRSVVPVYSVAVQLPKMKLEGIQRGPRKRA
jgi:hypothetical protein